MKNLFSQNQNLENNTRFVWNVEVQHYEENADVVKEMFDKMETAEFVKNHENVYREKMDKINTDEANDTIKNPPIEEPGDLYPKEDSGEKESPKSEKKENLGQRFARLLGWKKEKDNGVLSDDMKEIHANDSEAIQKPDTTKAANEKTEAEKETKENAEIDPITKLLGETKENEGAGYHSTAEVEAEVSQEENQGGGIGGLNIMKGTSDENFIDAEADVAAEGGNVDDNNYV